MAVQTHLYRRGLEALGELAMTVGGGLVTGAIVGLAFQGATTPPGLLASYLVLIFTAIMFVGTGATLRVHAPALARRSL